MSSPLSLCSFWLQFSSSFFDCRFLCPFVYVIEVISCLTSLRSNFTTPVCSVSSHKISIFVVLSQHFFTTMVAVFKKLSPSSSTKRFVTTTRVFAVATFLTFTQVSMGFHVPARMNHAVFAPQVSGCKVRCFSSLRSFDAVNDSDNNSIDIDNGDDILMMSPSSSTPSPLQPLEQDEFLIITKTDEMMTTTTTMESAGEYLAVKPLKHPSSSNPSTTIVTSAPSTTYSATPAKEAKKQVVVKENDMMPNNINKTKHTMVTIDSITTEVSNWITIVNRPKKFRISGHSALGTIATITFCIAIVPHLSIGINSISGLPQIYDMSNFHDSVLAKSVGFMFAITALAGLTRIPKSSSNLRRIMFETSACMTTLLYLIQDSNLGILSEHGWSLNLLDDGPAYCLTWFVYGYTVFKTLQFLEESIAAPDKGRETLPFNGSRIGMATIASSMVLLLFLNGPIIPACFFDHNREAFEAFCLPGLTYFGGWHTSGYFVVEAYIGFGMLISTLLFERQINQLQASWLMVANFVFSGLYDVATFFLGTAGVGANAEIPAALQSLLDYGAEVTSKFSLNEVCFALWGMYLIKTIIRVENDKKLVLQQQSAAPVLVTSSDSLPSSSSDMIIDTPSYSDDIE